MRKKDRARGLFSCRKDVGSAVGVRGDAVQVHVLGLLHLGHEDQQGKGHEGHADAQEQQKQNQEQKELEDELANLSPEELAELETMLAEQGQEQMPVEQEQIVAPEMMQQPVMSLGGAIRRFDAGSRLAKYDKPDYIKDEYSWLDGIDLDRLLKEAELLKINEDELKVDPVKTSVIRNNSIPTYATWPRYAGLAHNLFTAGVNMFQQPDHYEFPYLRAHEPEMQMPVLIDPVYRPTDKNVVVNDILSSGAGTARQIIDSGNPVSAPASLVALDYNIGRNIGTGLAQVDNANNSQLNNVITGKNNNRMQLGQLAFELARARSGALANADRINLHSNMSQQLYNNQAEQQWADAVGTPLDYFAQGMSDLGYENVNRNMINTNNSLLYGVDSNGRAFYKIPVRSAKCGGMLKTYKK